MLSCIRGVRRILFFYSVSPINMGNKWRLLYRLCFLRYYYLSTILIVSQLKQLIIKIYCRRDFKMWFTILHLQLREREICLNSNWLNNTKIVQFWGYKDHILVHCTLFNWYTLSKTIFKSSLIIPILFGHPAYIRSVEWLLWNVKIFEKNCEKI